MAKDETNKFKLDKGTDRGFDISKGGKRKFDLRKDVDEPVAAPAKPASVTNPVTPETAGHTNVTAEHREKSSKKWLLWVVAIIVIALLAWWLWPSSASHEAVEEGTVEEVTSPIDSASDTVTDEAVTPVTQPEADVQGEGAVSPEAEASRPATPSTPAATPSAPATMPEASAPISDDIEAEARKVIRGEYGVGQERRNRLGTQYQPIQQRVNELKREGVF